MCNKSRRKSLHTDRTRRVCVALMVFSATTYKTIYSYIFLMAGSGSEHTAARCLEPESGLCSENQSGPVEHVVL